jgi:hypothetical protein
VFVHGKPFQPSLVFAGKAGAYPKGECLKGIQALLKNIRLGCKSLPGRKALANYISSSVMKKKVFVNA